MPRRRSADTHPAGRAKKEWAPLLPKVTIHDVAREAGVTPKTVSRIMNNHPGVSEKTRQRVLEVIRQLGYYPHMGARGLRGKHRGSIGLTLPTPFENAPISGEFFVWLFTELHRLFGVRGEYVTFDLNPYVASPHGDYARGIWERLFKACVFCGPLRLDDITIARVHRSGIPYVVFGRLEGHPYLSYATVDYEKGAYLSTQFLIQRGHKNIGLLKSFHGLNPGLERERGYQRAMKEAGLSVEPSWIVPVPFHTGMFADRVYQLVKDRRITAVIDASGLEDGEALQAGARRAGRIAGADFEVLTWSYSDTAAVFSNAVAQMWLPTREAASAGITELYHWVYDERSGPIQILYDPILHDRLPPTPLAKSGRLFDFFNMQADAPAM
jgi:DNA-binding LacI/PurR family transcriptional regulator